MGRPTVSLLLRCCALLLISVAGATGSPQKPGVADEGIVILPVDPCELLLNRRAGGPQGVDRESLQVLTLGCLTRAKRDASGNTAEQPKARDPRGLFKKASKSQGGLLYPGTKWCGPGNVARSYWDLGSLADEDRCCREHDYCPEHIVAGRCSHGICNVTPFTRSHCACDDRFRHCLQALKSPVADTIGAIFFNVGNVLCFAEDEEDNDLPANMGDAAILESRLGLDSEAHELWPNAKDNLNTLGQRQRIGCSRRSNCRYRFHTQKHYTEAANDNNVIPAAVQGPRIHQQPEVNSRQLNLVMDKRSGVNDGDHQAAEILSKFFRHILRSTGILRPGS